MTGIITRTRTNLAKHRNESGTTKKEVEDDKPDFGYNESFYEVKLIRDHKEVFFSKCFLSYFAKLFFFTTYIILK